MELGRRWQNVSAETRDIAKPDIDATQRSSLYSIYAIRTKVLDSYNRFTVCWSRY